MPTPLDYALRYAELGWPVFPLSGKAPDGRLAPRGFKDASRNPDVIRDWWRRAPNGNIGVPCGEASGFWVMDVDPRNGGDLTFEAIERAHGALPETLVQRTGGGGRHYLFTYDARVQRGKLGEGIDVKRDGGYIVVEPSTTQAAYAFDDWDVFESVPPCVPAPAWLLKLVEIPHSTAQPTSAPSGPWNDDPAKLRSALAALSADDHDDWVRIGAALYHASGGAPAALDVWIWWSQMSAKFEAGACEKRWPSFERYAGGRMANVGTIYNEAARRGWRFYGLGPEPAPAASSSPAETVPREAKRSRAQQDEAWRSQLVLTDKGRVVPCFQNVAIVLIEHPVWRDVLGFDEFALKLVIRQPPAIPGFDVGEWNDYHTLQLGLWLAQQVNLVIQQPQTLSSGVKYAARSSPFHPVRDYLEGLEWDETARLATWLPDYLATEPTAYATCVGTYFLMNMVARVFDPGCVMRSVPVLEGPQNRGKSTALRMLAGRWFADSQMRVGEKDAYLGLQGVWLWEISEMASFNRAEAASVKQFVSSVSDRYRPPFGEHVMDVRRQTVFAGSTNDPIYLRDWTGNTRFWPVMTCVPSASNPQGSIRYEELGAVRDQLFAEAVARFRGHERRHPTLAEEANLFAPEQEERLMQHPWEPIVEHWLNQALDDHEQLTAKVNRQGLRMETSTHQVLAECLKIDASRLLPGHPIDVGRILSRMGWERKKRGPAAKREWIYVRPTADATEKAEA